MHVCRRELTFTSKGMTHQCWQLRCSAGRSRCLTQDCVWMVQRCITGIHDEAGITQSVYGLKRLPLRRRFLIEQNLEGRETRREEAGNMCESNSQIRKTSMYECSDFLVVQLYWIYLKPTLIASKQLLPCCRHRHSLGNSRCLSTSLSPDGQRPSIPSLKIDEV